MGLISFLASKLLVAVGVSLPDITELVRLHQKQLEAAMPGLKFQIAEDQQYGCRIATEKFDVIVYWLQREGWIVSDVEVKLDPLPPYVLERRYATASWLGAGNIKGPPYPSIPPNLAASTMLCEELDRVRLAIVSVLRDEQTTKEALNFLEGYTKGYTDRVSGPPESQPDVIRDWTRSRLKSMRIQLTRN